MMPKAPSSVPSSSQPGQEKGGVGWVCKLRKKRQRHVQGPRDRCEHPEPREGQEGERGQNRAASQGSTGSRCRFVSEGLKDDSGGDLFESVF